MTQATTEFFFLGVELVDRFTFALVRVVADPGDDNLGCAEITLRLPIDPKPGEPLESIHDAAIERAHRIVNESAILGG
jgi:hypothetical protein